jgi:hypothetical protein
MPTWISNGGAVVAGRAAGRAGAGWQLAQRGISNSVQLGEALTNLQINSPYGSRTSGSSLYHDCNCLLVNDGAKGGQRCRVGGIVAS